MRYSPEQPWEHIQPKGLTAMSKPIPPLTQTLSNEMSCEHGYALVEIQGMKTPQTQKPSYRGTDIHAALAPYALPLRTEACAGRLHVP
jgi:hypothetical protein